MALRVAWTCATLAVTASSSDVCNSEGLCPDENTLLQGGNKLRSTNRHLDRQAFTCDTTLDQRDQIREHLLAEVERHGFTSANPQSRTSLAQGEDSLGRPSRDLVYRVNPSNPESAFYKMHSPKDVTVWIGCSPPQGAWYFGCTQYLNRFAGATPLASMGDSLNQFNMHSTAEDFWGGTFVILTSADIQSAELVRTAIEQHAPTLSNAINIQVLPSELHSSIQLENGRAGALFSTGCRVSPRTVTDWDPSVQDEAAAYMTHVEPLLVLDGSQSQFDLMPFPTPMLRERTSGNHVELQLQDRYEEFMCRITQHAFDIGFVQTLEDSRDSFVPLTATSHEGEEFYLNGTNCILHGGNCLQDSPDALYMQGVAAAADMQVVVGVNHRLTGTAQYGYVTVGGAFSVHDRQSEGSAIPWADSLPEADLFTAFTVMQAEEECDDLPADVRAWCFNVMLDEDASVQYDERAYLNPITSTGPSQDELLPSTVLRFRLRQSEDTMRPICSEPQQEEEPGKGKGKGTGTGKGKGKGKAKGKGKGKAKGVARTRARRAWALARIARRG